MPFEDTVSGKGAVPGEATGSDWSLAQRLLFRFALIYFLLYTHPFPLNLIPNPRTVESAFSQEWGWLKVTDPFYEVLDGYSDGMARREWAAIDAMASGLFAIEEPLDRPWGSGDPTHSYIRILLHLVLALAGTAIWSLFARRKRAHRTLSAWLHVGVRYNLALTMWSYGMSKVIPTQFRAPGPTRLLASWGDSSPMNVLWTFMGSSEPYIIFGGAGEVLGGLLLLFRRTATLGALVTAGVMANVVALNFFYDVPVKLYSSHLLLFAVCICLPDARRLLALLVLNRDAPRRDLREPRIPRAGRVAKWIVVGIAILGMLSSRLDRYETASRKPELYGIWDVERFVLDGEEVPPLQTDPVRWQNLIVESERFGVIRGMDDTRWSYGLAMNEEDSALTFSSQSTWGYRLEAPDLLFLRGEFQRIFRPVPSKAEGPENRSLPRAPQIEIRLRRAVEDAEPEGASSARLSELEGRWEVTGSEVIGETFLPRRRAVPSDWVALRLGSDEAIVEYENAHREEYVLAVDETLGQMKLSSASTLSIDRPSEDRLRLSGRRCGHEVDVEFTRRDLREFLLVRRGFHWINEIPLNRY